jgi:hypothetical protein
VLWRARKPNWLALRRSSRKMPKTFVWNAIKSTSLSQFQWIC